MRRTVMVGFGIVAAAVLTAAGVAAATGSGSGSPAAATVADTVATSQASTSDTAVAGMPATAAQARQAALAAVPGGTVTEVRPEIRGGVRVWNVHVRSGTRSVEVIVDATTGRVVGVEVNGHAAGPRHAHGARRP